MSASTVLLERAGWPSRTRQDPRMTTCLVCYERESGRVCMFVVCVSVYVCVCVQRIQRIQFALIERPLFRERESV